MTTASECPKVLAWGSHFLVESLSGYGGELLTGVWAYGIPAGVLCSHHYREQHGF